MNKVLACIDGSAYGKSVCDYAIWAAQRLQAPLELLHVLDRHPETAPMHDMSGSLGLGAQDSLLQELASVDEQRGKLAQRRGIERGELAIALLYIVASVTLSIAAMFSWLYLVRSVS